MSDFFRFVEIICPPGGGGSFIFPPGGEIHFPSGWRWFGVVVDNNMLLDCFYSPREIRFLSSVPLSLVMVGGGSSSPRGTRILRVKAQEKVFRRHG